MEPARLKRILEVLAETDSEFSIRFTQVHAIPSSLNLYAFCEIRWKNIVARKSGIGPNPVLAKSNATERTLRFFFRLLFGIPHFPTTGLSSRFEDASMEARKNAELVLNFCLGSLEDSRPFLSHAYEASTYCAELHVFRMISKGRNTNLTACLGLSRTLDPQSTPTLEAVVLSRTSDADEVLTIANEKITPVFHRYFDNGASDLRLSSAVASSYASTTLTRFLESARERVCQPVSECSFEHDLLDRCGLHFHLSDPFGLFVTRDSARLEDGFPTRQFLSALLLENDD